MEKLATMLPMTNSKILSYDELLTEKVNGP